MAVPTTQLCTTTLAELRSDAGKARGIRHAYDLYDAAVKCGSCARLNIDGTPFYAVQYAAVDCPHPVYTIALCDGCASRFLLHGEGEE